jgi:hypothetical protein
MRQFSLKVELKLESQNRNFGLKDRTQLRAELEANQMVRRILIGAEGDAEPQGAVAMALDLFANGTIIAAWDLSSGGFFNTARVISQLNVITPADQAAFDAVLDVEGKRFNVIRRNDVGAYLGVVGVPIQPPHN